MSDVPLLSSREAAHRVGRSIRTVWRWRAMGMPMSWGVREGPAVRVVREDVLLAFWRARMIASPVHQYRVRAALRADQGAEDQEAVNGSR